MIFLKSKTEIEKMRIAGEIVRDALLLAGEKLEAGMTTKELDIILEKFIRSQKAVPSFLNYNGFPASACISINEQVIHGIPSRLVKIKEGDIVSVDIGAYINGFHGDAARTFLVGNVSEDAKKLVKVTEECYFKGIEKFSEGNHIGDIGNAVQRHAEQNGFSVVKTYVGHGIGRKMHEDPSVPNYGVPGRGSKISVGMALAIEPMINMGSADVAVLPDDWTVVTRDSLPSAHYENTAVLTENGLLITTL